MNNGLDFNGKKGKLERLKRLPRGIGLRSMDCLSALVEDWRLLQNDDNSLQKLEI